MSTGAVFKLIVNDGKADKLITATAMLNQRLKDIEENRAKLGHADVTPTLADIESSHILYVNAHYKPYAAVGFEYNKVKPQQAPTTLGETVTFAIPQFGDFFHDMVVRTRLSAFNGLEGIAPVQNFDDVVLFPSNLIGDGAIIQYSLVDSFGNPVLASEPQTSSLNEENEVVTVNAINQPYYNYVRYCEYPGNRLFKLVKFDVNGNALDSYDEMVPTMLEKFCTPPNKRIGHDRLCGQEVALTGYGGLKRAAVRDRDVRWGVDNTQTYNTPAGISRTIAGQSNQTVAVFDEAYTTMISPQGVIKTLNEEGFNTVDYSRNVKQFVNGPQTPKPMQAPLELWTKLRFWFNDDVRLAVPSVSVPYGQRYITLDMNRQELLAFEFPSLYVQKIDYTSDPTKITWTYAPYFQKLGITPITIEACELYINNIFISPEIHDIYIRRIGFSLIRCYRQHTQRCDISGTDERLLSQLKWPIEYMFAGLRPVWNITPTTKKADNIAGLNSGQVVGNQNQWRDWHRMTRMVDATANSQFIYDKVTEVTNEPSDVTILPYALTSSMENGSFDGLWQTPSFGTSATADTTTGAITWHPINTSYHTDIMGIIYGALNNTNVLGPVSDTLLANAASAQTATLTTKTVIRDEIMPDEYWLPVPTVNSLSLTAHSIAIYDTFADTFFNQYAPLHFGGQNINTPEDVGALFINFALFPRSYQPSGHFNISRAREFYLKWNSSYISPTSPVDLLVIAVAINFLLIADGAAVLRYST